MRYDITPKLGKFNIKLICLTSIQIQFIIKMETRFKKYLALSIRLKHYLSVLSRQCQIRSLVQVDTECKLLI